MDLDVTSPKQLNRRVFLKQLAVDLCTSERRILFRAQYVRIYLLISKNYTTDSSNVVLIMFLCWMQILGRRLRDIRSGELRALRLFDNFRKLFKWVFTCFVSNKMLFKRVFTCVVSGKMFIRNTCFLGYCFVSVCNGSYANFHVLW